MRRWIPRNHFAISLFVIALLHVALFVSWPMPDGGWWRPLYIGAAGGWVHAEIDNRYFPACPGWQGHDCYFTQVDFAYRYGN